MAVGCDELLGRAKGHDFVSIRRHQVRVGEPHPVVVLNYGNRQQFMWLRWPLWESREAFGMDAANDLGVDPQAPVPASMRSTR